MSVCQLGDLEFRRTVSTSRRFVAICVLTRHLWLADGVDVVDLGERKRKTELDHSEFVG